MSKAGPNDIITFTTAGHGYLNNLNYAGGDMSYSQIAGILDGAAAGRIFIFVDHCFSGSGGPNMMALPTKANIYMTTTCSDNGYGWDDPSHQNGAWTWQFLDWGLIQKFSNSNIDMEACFDAAAAAYPHTGGDAAQEFDGSTAELFYLRSGSRSIEDQLDSWDGDTQKLSIAMTPYTLEMYLANPAAVDATRELWWTGSARGPARTATVDQSDKVQRIAALLDMSQTLTSSAARCLFDYDLSFTDRSGSPLGRVGICTNEDIGENHRAVYIPFSPDGEQVRMGMVVPDGAALVDILEESF